MNTHRAPEPDTGDDRRQLLSALADGQPDATERGCGLWRDDAGARATWHTYHLIGDVMRSEDLASTSVRDAAFLAALRNRLAEEPVVLAPVAVAPRRRQRWVLPMAAAAGFVAVAGVVVVARMQAAVEGPLVASGDPVPGVQVVRNGEPVARAPQRLVLDGKIIRDAQLDAYLEAHRQAFGGPSPAMPGGVPRNIEMLAPVAAPGPR